ncbi:MAG: S-adenosyl-l-methionine hydroxide adenosyltransferase family protein [Pseudomonadota bacterium]
MNPFRPVFIAIAGWAVSLSAAPAAQQAANAPAPVIVFMTDFGTLDDAVAICKGVMLGLAPAARIVDLTHQVRPYSIADGARFLARTSLYYPANTIFVGVVDPGVGTQRRTIIAKTKRGQYFVVPDNGLLTPIEDRDGIEAAREITNAAWMLPGPHSATFHGRDVFSPVAGHLARGDDWTKVGPVLAKLTRLSIAAPVLDDRGITGHVIGLDGPYGNLITDIKPEKLRELGYATGDTVKIEVSGQQFLLPFVTTFGDVPEGKPLLYIDSSGLVSVAINMGNFAQAHEITPPAEFSIARRAQSSQ